MRHYIINNATEGTTKRVAVLGGEMGTLKIETLAGPTITPLELDALLGESGMWDAAHAAHKTRKHRFAVQKHVGMSGAFDYLLREEKDPVIGDYPIVARLHVSMYRKLNGGGLLLAWGFNSPLPGGWNWEPRAPN